MQWESLTHFFNMGGHGFYVWTAYSMMVVLAAVEIFGLRSRRIKAVTRLTREARAVRDTREG